MCSQSILEQLHRFIPLPMYLRIINIPIFAIEIKKKYIIAM